MSDERSDFVGEAYTPPPKRKRLRIRRVGVFCGAKWYRWSDWKLYGLYQNLGVGFSIGPIIFWDGS